MLYTKRKSLILLAVVLAWLAHRKPVAEAQQPGPPELPEVVFAERHDTSPPLRAIPVNRPRPAINKAIQRHVPLDIIGRNRPRPPVQDAVRQTSGTTSSTTPTPGSTSNFEGLSDADNQTYAGFRVVPPDTEGDVGPNHYVQMINLIFAVYSKSGALLYGPAANNTLWAGFGGACEANNDGDPVVLYDHLAGRWVFTQFALSNHGYQCFAISQTGDPMGSYHRYEFRVSTRAINDYPKLGVWPDGYYYTANEFSRFGQFRGAIAVAFERDKMLNGQSARAVKFGPLGCTSNCFFSLQPSHLEGPPPAAGTPNTFVMAWDDQTWGTGSGPDGYRLWNFAADWASSTFSFTSLGQVNTTAPFDAELCGYSRECIPQPAPGEKLDVLGQFTMFRAQYRQFAGHASLLVNHTVDADGSSTAGIRWTELRNSGAGWSLYQTGTFAPTDELHRWMGSIAMDRAGNIALGYSASGTDSMPSIRYNTRTAGDPLGTLPGGEMILHAGTGVQINSANRWGDYSTMSVDPVDDCTFWYTQEYYASTGSFDFRTRIGSFKLPNCGGEVHDVAATNVAAPSPVLVNATETVIVSVSNFGTVAETFSVSLADTLGSTNDGPHVVNLAAGSSTTVNFNWTPTQTGTHELTGTATLAGDSNPSNNSASTSSTVNEPSAGVAVTAIDPNTVAAGSTDVPATISGSGFAAGATVAFVGGEGPAPSASEVVVTSSTSISLKITVKSGGPRRDRFWDVRVTNPDGSNGTLSGGLRITP